MISPAPNIRFVSQGVDWTGPMKEAVADKIVEPLRRVLKTDHFELSVYFGPERRRRAERFEM
ncbi:MAG: hypothetical protein HC902_12085, partial [Calothrix sp. SM1_5_4]|nr:hypothetical protein [Calothrix sp. SM1_5_4]